MEKKNYAMKAISKEVILRNDLSHDIETERDYLYAAKSPFIVSLIHHFEVSRLNVLFLLQLENADVMRFSNLQSAIKEAYPPERNKMIGCWQV